MTIASFFSSFLPTIYADAPAPDEEQPPNGEQPVKEEVVEEADIKVVEKAVVEEEPAEEDDEPEDVRVFNAHHSQPFPKHSFFNSYRSTLLFATNVKRRQNALL